MRPSVIRGYCGSAEAMKMQSNYKVTSDCTVRDILVNEGDSVNTNQVLIVLDIIKRRLIMTEKKYTAGLKSWTNARRWAAVWTRSRTTRPREDDRSRAYRNVAGQRYVHRTGQAGEPRCTNFGMEKKQIAGDGMVTGYGKIDGRPVFVYAYDFTAHGGSLSETNAAKIVSSATGSRDGSSRYRPERLGRRTHPRRGEQPCRICLYFLSGTLSPQVLSPQISAILGPCAGGLLLTGTNRFYLYGKRRATCSSPARMW